MPAQPARMLGRLASTPDPRTLRLAKYLKPTLPPPPPFVRWDNEIDDWGVMGNDRHGNCTTVTAAHMRLCWRANELDDTKRLTDEQVIRQARAIGGLNGFAILERNRIWRRSGLWGDTLHAYAAVKPADAEQHKHAISLFGASDVGLNMPRAWQDENPWGTGDGPAYRPNSWGSHSVPLLGYDERCAYCCTWGKIQAVTWEAILRYCDEAYALIDNDWTAADGISPSGFDRDALERDLAALAA